MSRLLKKNKRDERWWSRTLILHLRVRDLLVVIGLAIVMQYLDYRGALSQWEGWFLDIALLLGPRPANPRPVVTVEIDDDAYKSFFGSTSPLDPEVLLKMVEKVATIDPKPAVIGIDILTESPKYARLAKGDWLKGTVWAANPPQPKSSSPPRSPSFLGWFFGIKEEWDFSLPVVLGTTELSNIKWGASIYFPDRDLGMRKLTRELELSKDSGDIDVWARQVANAVERNKNGDPEVLVSYNAPAPLEYKVSNIFVCQPLDGKCRPDNLKRGALWAEFEKEFQQKSRPIVLIGGTYEHRDYPTPIGRQPALIIDAYAVQAELNHTYVKDFPAWLKFMFDIPLGLATGWLIHRYAKHSVRRGMQISFLIAAIIIVVNVSLIHVGILWFSFAGVAFGAMLERLIELYVEDPKEKAG